MLERLDAISLLAALAAAALAAAVLLQPTN
jgi:hypothetical protein